MFPDASRLQHVADIWLRADRLYSLRVSQVCSAEGIVNGAHLCIVRHGDGHVFAGVRISIRALAPLSHALDRIRDSATQSRLDAEIRAELEALAPVGP